MNAIDLVEGVLYLYLISAAFMLIWAVCNNYDLDLLPSFFWFFLITLPLAMQLDTFSSYNIELQIFGTIFIGLLLFLGDVKTVPVFATAHNKYSFTRSLLSDPKVYVTIFLLIATTHVLLLDDIPIWQKYVNHIENAKELQMMRENSSKLLMIPDLFKYIFNWIVNIVAPVALCLLIFKKRYVAAFVFFVVAILYAKLSLAKVPSVILFMCVFVAVLWTIPYSSRVKLYVAGMLCLAPILFYSALFFTMDKSSLFQYSLPDNQTLSFNLPDSDPRSVLTIGDISRLQPRATSDDNHFLKGRLNYYMYRAFLVPVEVSNRWYQYFPKYSGGFASWDGLLPGRRSDDYVHPAQRVGNWAYTERFPQWYIKSVRAYASVDAEAYGRFGLLGIVLVGVMIYALRVALKFLLSDEPVVKVFYATGVVILALLLPMASIQAILVANGLVVIIGIMLLSRWLCYRSSSLAEDP